MSSKSDLPSQQATPTQIQKQIQLNATLQWVEANYEWSEGVCVPRCVVYQHYQDFCRTRPEFVAVGPATFGKIIRQGFPRLTTRRLGTRGQSRYHYYGIGIKETSIYYKQTRTGKGLSRFSGARVKNENSGKRYSPSSKAGFLLPNFPELEDLNLDDNLDKEKARTFLAMYRTHCQRILDTIIAANFDEVHKFILHFWQGMPDHLFEILQSGVLALVIAGSDVILYKALNDVLVPPDIQELPESLHHDVKCFTRNLPVWLTSSLEGCPALLQRKKLEVASWFVSFVNRQLSFIRLAETARGLLNSSDNARKMALDLGTLDVVAMTSQLAILFTASRAMACMDRINTHYDTLIALLRKQSPLEDFLEWIDDVIDNCLTELEAGDKDTDLVRRAVQPHPVRFDLSDFVLSWSYLISLIVRDLTLRNSPSFGSVHVVSLMFDEYVFLVVETQRVRNRCRTLQTDVAATLKPESHFDVLTIGLDPETRYDDSTSDAKPDIIVEHHNQVGTSTSASAAIAAGAVDQLFHEDETRDGMASGWPTTAPACHPSSVARGYVSEEWGRAGPSTLPPAERPWNEAAGSSCQYPVDDMGCGATSYLQTPATCPCPSPHHHHHHHHQASISSLTPETEAARLHQTWEEAVPDTEAELGGFAGGQRNHPYWS